MDLSATQLWLILGIGLIIVEMVSATFMLLFFGIAALLVALLALLGMESLTLQILVFALFGLSSLVVFREKIKKLISSKNSPMVDGLQNVHIQLDADIPAHGSNTIGHQGTTWIAVNNTDVDMKVGDHVVISKVDGVKLILIRGNSRG